MGEDTAQTPEVNLELLAQPMHRIFLSLAASRCGVSWSYLLYLWLYTLGGGKPVAWPNMSLFVRLFNGKLDVNRRKIYRAMAELRDAGLIDYRGGTESDRRIEFLIPENFPIQTMADYAAFMKEMKFAAVLPLIDSPRKINRKPKAETPAIEIPSGENSDVIPLEDSPDTGPVPSSPTKFKSRLSPDDRAKICSSLDNMRNYLLWGKPGIYEPGKEHKPSNLNWRQFRQGEGNDEVSVGIPKWNVNHFSGYFWHSVSIFRASRGIEIMLPQWGRLLGEVKNLLATGTNWRTFNYLGQLSLHFDVICCMAGNHCKDTPLDERVINHTQITQSVNVWLNAGEAQRAQWAQDYRSQVEQRELRLYGKNVYYVQNQGS